MDSGRGEGGFGLVELMVVVLVIAILLAIAIPVYLSSRERAADRAVQSVVRHAYGVQKALYVDGEGYEGDPVVMEDEEPSIDWTTDPPVSHVANQVYVEVIDGETLVLAGRSSTGRCFFVRDRARGSGAGSWFASADPVEGACEPPAPNDPSWRPSW